MTASIFGTSVHGKKAIKAGGGGVTKTKMIKHLEKTIEAQACQKRKMAKAVKYYEQELENVKRFHQIMVEIMAEDIASLRMELNEIREERDLWIKEINEIPAFRCRTFEQETERKGAESWKDFGSWRGVGSWELSDFISVK